MREWFETSIVKVVTCEVMHTQVAMRAHLRRRHRYGDDLVGLAEFRARNEFAENPEAILLRSDRTSVRGAARDLVVVSTQYTHAAQTQTTHKIPTQRDNYGTHVPLARLHALSQIDTAAGRTYGPHRLGGEALHQGRPLLLLGVVSQLALAAAAPRV